ncbi:MAG: hypothetical protein Tsb0016_26090 [Sphingomonadales bacterium]
MYATYPWTVGASLLAILVLIWLMGRVGTARGKYKISAPATAGDPAFERVYRAHLNSVEQFVLFLPALWLFAAAWGDAAAGILGLLWSLARVHYAIAYGRAAEKRGLGMMAGFMVLLALVLGAAAKWLMLWLG